MSEPRGEITIDGIAESFAARLATGERPSIEEYKHQYPEFSDEIDEVLPALVILENIDLNHENRELFTNDSIPRVLGDFRIVNEIGRGGMGIVFEAEHVTMRRRVALKVLPKSSADKPSYLNRFFTEARSAGQLHHTNIVPVFEFGEAHGLHFYAMQFIRGDNLDRVIEEVKRLKSLGSSIEKNTKHCPAATGALPGSQLSKSIAVQMIGKSASNAEPSWAPDTDATTANIEPKSQLQPRPAIDISPITSSESVLGSDSLERPDSIFDHGKTSSVRSSRDAYHKRVAAIGVQVGEALEHAHSRGVLHRDVKPANLILDTDGNVWVTDFGLAKLQTDDLTQTGDIIGTLRYMAPERFEGKADRRSDIYSLGLTLYELCTLRTAFGSNRESLVKDVANSSIVSPRKIDDSIPLDLDTIIMKAIAPEPDQRYKTAADMVDDLNHFLQDLPITARRTACVERFWRICRRNPVMSSLVGCILALLATVGVVIAISLFRFAELSAERADSERDLKETAQVSLFYSKVDQAKMRRFSGRLGQRHQSLSAIKEAADLMSSLDFSRIKENPDELRFALRNEAVAALSLTDFKQIWSHQSKQGKQSRYRLTIDRSGDHLAEGFEDGRIVIRSVKDNSTTIIPPVSTYPCWQIEFSPNSRYLASRHHAPGAGIGEMQLFVWDLENLSEPVFTAEKAYVFSFSNDGETIAYTQGKAIQIYSLAEMKPKINLVAKLYSEAESNNRPVRRIRFNNDDSEIALFQHGGKVVEFWRIKNTARFLHQVKITEEIHTIDWDSEQNLFVIGSHRGGLYFWTNSIEEEPSFLQLHQNSITNLHIHPTRKLVVTTAWDNTSRATDLLSGREVLMARGLSLTYGDFTQRGNIAFVDSDGEFGLWEVASPLLETYNNSSRYGWNVAFHPIHSNIVARTSDTSIEFWDTQDNSLAFKLPDMRSRDLRFSSDGKSLYTSGTEGLQRWRVNLQTNENEKIYLSIDSPTQLINQATGYFDMTRNEDVIVVGVGSKPRAVSTTDGQLINQFGSHGGLQAIQLTADDKYVLTGTYKGDGIKIWNMINGSQVKTSFPDINSIAPTAHPLDAGVYWVSGGGIRKNWLSPSNNTMDESRQIFHPAYENASNAVFSQTGKLLGMRESAYKLVLADPVSGEPLVAMESGGQNRILWFRFSPDEETIALACYENLQTVSLRALRSELARLGLDWSTR